MIDYCSLVGIKLCNTTNWNILFYLHSSFLVLKGEKGPAVPIEIS